MTYGRTVRTKGDEKNQFKREALDGGFASVETKVVGSGSETSIDYRLHDVNGQWKVYDMVIEHVSLLSSFRSQSQREITRTSDKELLEKMKQRNS